MKVVSFVVSDDEAEDILEAWGDVSGKARMRVTIYPAQAFSRVIEIPATLVAVEPL